MICKICGKDCAGTEQTHHPYSQGKHNRRIYGRKLIENPANKVFPVCAGCNGSHAAGKKLPRYDERKFCEAVGVKPRSKSDQIRALREAQYEAERG